MDPNMTHSDAERTDESTDSSPGGVQPVEQPAPHEVPLPPSPPDSEESVADHAPPAALQRRAAEQREDGSWVELPEEVHAYITEILGRHQYDPLDFQGDTMVLEIEDGQIVGMHPVNPADPSGQEILAVIRQLEAEPGTPARPPQRDVVLDSERGLHALPPSDLVRLENFYNAVRSHVIEFSNTSNHPGLSEEEFDAFMGELEYFRRAAEILDEGTYQDQIHFLAAAEEDVLHVQQVVVARREAVTLLDSLVRTNLDSSMPQSASDNDNCSICLEDYVASVTVVVLPCHPSHNFHRRCIEDWLAELIPDPLSCPICRSEIALIDPDL